MSAAPDTERRKLRRDRPRRRACSSAASWVRRIVSASTADIGRGRNSPFEHGSSLIGSARSSSRSLVIASPSCARSPEFAGSATLFRSHVHLHAVCNQAIRRHSRAPPVRSAPVSSLGMGERGSRRYRRQRTRVLLAVVAGGALAGGAVGAGAFLRDDATTPVVAAAEPLPATSAPPPTTAATLPPTTVPPFSGWVDPASVGQPYYQATVPGLLTFRGNPTRTYYGQGPVPAAPHGLWKYPGRGMCSLSEDRGETTEWCGTGWTGQPAVFERDGRTWVVFGAYDRAVHFVDATTGEDLLTPFPTGDIIKGSVTIDPDGFPLVYTGSRDGFFRVLAFDRAVPTELWRLSAHDVSPTLWNDDWDSSALVLGDYLFEGGENSQLHIVKLNRAVGPDGLVTVAPELVFHAPGWDDELTAAVGQRGLDRELGRDLGRHPLLRQLRRARPGLGHRRPAHRRRAAHPGLPLLDR